MTRAPRAHDLLLLDEVALAHTAGAPAWVRPALRETPWVVVRRGTAPAGLVAVGVRGDERGRRWAWAVPSRLVRACTTPEELADVRPASRHGVPALAGLVEARWRLEPHGFRWGPIGSVGFELATGRATVTADSDLDLLVRAPLLTKTALGRLGDLHRSLGKLPVRVDCQVELAAGAVALTELVDGGQTVLVRTAHGPELVRVAELLL